MHRQLRLLLRSVPAEAFVAVLDDPVHELLDSDLESGCPLRRRHLLKRLYIGSLLRQVVQVRVDEVVDVERIWRVRNDIPEKAGARVRTAVKDKAAAIGACAAHEDALRAARRGL